MAEANPSTEAKKSGSCTCGKIIVGLVVGFVVVVAVGGGIAYYFINKPSTSKGGGQTNFPTPAPTSAPTGISSHFDIELTYLTSVSDTVKQAFENARLRWQELVTDDLPSMVYIRPGELICSGVPRALKRINIDDLLIFVEIKPIDGAGEILGSAGPCIADSSGLVRAGIMTFDSADIAEMEADGSLEAVILHEMGHVLGLGTLWEIYNLIAMYQYFGPQGNLGHKEIGGTGDRAKIEDQGGEGTANGHWKESVYEDELMTGWISGSAQPLSRLTARALEDLGYVVDVSKADNFTLGGAPSGRRLRGSGLDRKRGFRIKNDVYTGPIFIADNEVAKPGREKEFVKAKREAAKRIEQLRKRFATYNLNRTNIIP